MNRKPHSEQVLYVYRYISRSGNPEYRLVFWSIRDGSGTPAEMPLTEAEFNLLVTFSYDYEYLGSANFFEYNNMTLDRVWKILQEAIDEQYVDDYPTSHVEAFGSW